MGVSGLWTLLTPVGRPVQLENMEGKKMAIDSSIWLYQFQATMRDKDGRGLVNAHVLGFLRRICKLLFYGIRPVFVFDGGAPALKKVTINERKKKKSGAAQSYARTAEKILAAQMRREALNRQPIPKLTAEEVTAQKAAEEALADAVYMEDIDGSPPKKRTPRKDKGKERAKESEPSANAPKSVKNRWHDHDPYRLPDLDLDAAISKATGSSAPDPRLATEDELRAFIDEMVPEDFDTGSEAFRSLPTEVQYEIIGDLRLKSRQTSHMRLQAMLDSAPTALDFSKAQIVNLKQRNALTQQLLATTETVGKVKHSTMPTRIASERNRQYVLVKNNDKDGGWVLGVRDEGTHAKPIDVDKGEDDMQEPTDDEDEDEDMEEIVPARVLPDPDWMDHQRSMALAAIGNRNTSKGLSALSTRLQASAASSSRVPPKKSKQPPLFQNDNDDEEFMDEDGAVALIQTEDHALEIALQESLEDHEIQELQRAIEESRAEAEEEERRRQFRVDRSSQMSGSTYVTLMSRVSGHAAKLAAVRNSILQEPNVSPIARRDDTSPSPQSASSLFTSPVFPRISSVTAFPPTTPSPGNALSKATTSTPSPRGRLPKKHSFPSPISLSTSRPLDNGLASSTAQKTDSFKASKTPVSRSVSRTSHRASAGEAQNITPVMTTVPGNTAMQLSEPVSPTSASFGHNILDGFGKGPSYVPPSSNDASPSPPADLLVHLSKGKRESPRDVEVIELPSDNDMEEVMSVVPRSALIRPTVAPKQQRAEPIAIDGSADDTDADGPMSLSPVFSAVNRSRTSSPISPPHSDKPPSVITSIVPDLLPAAADSSDEEPEQWDAAQEMDADAEEGEFAQFMSQVRGRDLDAVRDEIDEELRVLNKQKKAAMRDSEDITQQMISQIQLMLRLFGIPYVTAPMEAEAQCAALVSLGLVEGIITDDSDVFLFGGLRVFRNMFNQSKTVECFLLSDLARELSLDRDTLVRLAYLLGSDYTDGLPGVGPVLAMELLKEFPGQDGLHRFKEWWLKVQTGKDRPQDNSSPFRKRFKKRFKDLHLSEEWPPAVVRDAYFHPTIDESEEPFKWGLPDLDALREFLNSELSWSAQKVDDTLLPIIRKMGQRGKPGNVNKQNTLDSFFDASVGSGTYAPRKRQAYASKRLQKVVSDFRKERKSLEGSASTTPAPGGEGDTSSDEEEAQEPPKPKRRVSKKNNNADEEGAPSAPGPAPANKKGRGTKRKAEPKTASATKKKAAPRKKRRVAAESSAEDSEEFQAREEGAALTEPDRPLEVQLRPRPQPRPQRRTKESGDVGNRRLEDHP